MSWKLKCYKNQEVYVRNSETVKMETDVFCQLDLLEMFIRN